MQHWTQTEINTHFCQFFNTSMKLHNYSDWRWSQVTVGSGPHAQLASKIFFSCGDLVTSEKQNNQQDFTQAPAILYHYPLMSIFLFLILFNLTRLLFPMSKSTDFCHSLWRVHQWNHCRSEACKSEWCCL